MHNDSPDTIAIEETQWMATQMDDVFLPSVRVQLGWKDIEAAVESGAVVPQQAHALWAGWAASTSRLRVGAMGVPRDFEPTQDLSAETALATPSRLSGAVQRYGLLIGLFIGMAAGAAATMVLVG